MKKHVYILILIFIAFSCEKENSQEDYRTPYTGLFKYITIKSTMVMCLDTTGSPTNVPGIFAGAVRAPGFTNDSIYFSDAQIIGAGAPSSSVFSMGNTYFVYATLAFRLA